MQNQRFASVGGLCINPEAGEIFYLTRAEKRRVLEIAMEEAQGKLPILAGTWALATEECVETARDAKTLGVDGIFVTPPGGAQDVTSCWDADSYPEIWTDMITGAGSRRGLAAYHHASGFRIDAALCTGLPVKATVQICKEVPNIVGWKMTYAFYEGYRTVAKGLRSLNRHVAVMGALASRFHEYNLIRMFDGTLSGFWNFALEPMLDHLEAWRNRDLNTACQIWDGGLSQLQDYVADMGRLHIRYKTAAWLRG